MDAQIDKGYFLFLDLDVMKDEKCTVYGPYSSLIHFHLYCPFFEKAGA